MAAHNRGPQELPPLIGLCPVHQREFYMPLDPGESEVCPMCDEQMVVYGPVEPASHDEVAR
jgi:hypothetical protein